MAAAPQQCALTARLSASTSASSSSRARPTSQFAQPQRIVHLRHARGRANLSVRAQSDGSMPVQEGVAKERQKIFNNIAPVYDQLNDLLSLGLHRSWKLATIMWSGARPGDRVLDVCCGSGDIAMQLAQTVGSRGAVVGLDFAADQLAVAANREASLAPGDRCRVDWREGDALALPFEESEFSAVTCGYGLRNVADIQKALCEMHRVLKPGGKVAVLDFNNSSFEPVNQLQGFLLDNLVVPVARANGVASEYEYLRPSIARFPRGPEQVALARKAGFADAVHYELAGGLMGVLVGTRRQ